MDKKIRIGWIYFILFYFILFYFILFENFLKNKKESFWVATEICLEKDLRRRALILDAFIRIAKVLFFFIESLYLFDFLSFSPIFLGFLSF